MSYNIRFSLFSSVYSVQLVMNSCWILFFIINLFSLFRSEIIEIEDGKLLGTSMRTRRGANFYAFLKIPFAQPPVENLRFQPPIKNHQWNGTLNATIYGPMCMQNYYQSEFGMSEDCLHLNVFSKNLMPNELKPVIVYVHGGVSIRT